VNRLYKWLKSGLNEIAMFAWRASLFFCLFFLDEGHRAGRVAYAGSSERRPKLFSRRRIGKNVILNGEIHYQSIIYL